MTGLPHSRGDISRELVARCNDALRAVVATDRQEIWGALRTRPDPAWESWIFQQPSKQRSYLRTVRLNGGAMALAAFINGQDHALLLGDVFNEPKDGIRIWSYLTVARGALEAWVRAAALQDRWMSPEKLILTQAATMIDGEANQRTLARELDPSMLDRLRRQQEKDEQRFTRCGIELERTKGRVSSVKRGECRVNTVLNVTDEATRRLEALPGAYRIGSAAMHSGAWFLASAMGDGNELRPAADADLLVTATAIVLEGHVALLHALSGADSPEAAKEARGFADHHYRLILRCLHRDHGPSSTRTGR